MDTEIVTSLGKESLIHPNSFSSAVSLGYLTLTLLQYEVVLCIHAYEKKSHVFAKALLKFLLRLAQIAHRSWGLCVKGTT